MNIQEFKQAVLAFFSDRSTKTAPTTQPQAAPTPPLPPDHCFSSLLIHTNDPSTISNWGLLRRGFDDEENIKACIDKIRGFTMVTYDGLAHLYNIARYLSKNDIPGAFVETGVWQGGASALMGLAALGEGKVRTLHLFDSFMGIPQPIQEEYEDWMEASWGAKRENANGSLVGLSTMAVGQDRAESVLFDIVQYPREAVTIHPGWFQHTVPVAAESVGPIALLRLDGDLYESTMVCLKHLYPKVIIGGFVIIDDYAIMGCRKACHDYFKEIGIAPFLHHIDGMARYFVKMPRALS